MKKHVIFIHVYLYYIEAVIKPQVYFFCLNVLISANGFPKPKGKHFLKLNAPIKIIILQNY